MTSKTFLPFSIALLLICFAACTDVPLSFSNNIPDERIVGYWKTGDNEAMQIKKNSDGTVTLISYVVDPETKKLEVDGEPAPMYFTTIINKRDTCHFFSIETMLKMQKCYTNTRFYISSAGALVTQNIKAEFMGKTHKADENGVINFGSSEKFRAFIKANLNDPDLYEPKESVTRF